MVTASDLHPWTLQEDGSYTRPLAHSEHLFKLVALKTGGNHIDSIASAVIRTPYDEGNLAERLKTAWIAMYCRYPHVASTESNLIFTFRPFKSWQDVDGWVEETLFINRKLDASVDLLNYPGQNTPTVRPQLHYLTRTHEVVLKSQHITFDALGGTSFLGQLAELINKPEKANPIGLDNSRLAPSMQDALGHQNAVSDIHINGAEVLINEYCQQFPSVGPVIRKSEGPNNIQRAFHTFSPEQTERIVEGAKECGTKVTALVHTALIRTLMEDPNNHCLGAEANFSSFTFVETRSHIKDDWLSRYPFTPYVSMFPFFHKAGLTTKNTIKVVSDYFATLQENYKSNDPVADQDSVNPMFSMYPISERMVAPWMQKEPPNANLVPVSSFGILDKYLSKQYGDVEVESFSLTMNMNNPYLTVSFYTWQGRLTINLSYNEKFYSPVYSQGIARGIANNVLQILDESKTW
jgi:hypothetical protein